MYFKIKSEQTKVVNKNDKLNEIIMIGMIIIREEVETENGKEKPKKRTQSLLGKRSVKRGRLCRDIQHRDR